MCRTRMHVKTGGHIVPSSFQKESRERRNTPERRNEDAVEIKKAMRYKNERGIHAAQERFPKIFGQKKM